MKSYKIAVVPGDGTGPEVIAGVTLKDAKRASKWPAYVDVAQSVTGAILGIFLFCHMAFTSSIQVGKDLFWNLIQVSGGTPIFGHEQIWLHFLFVGFFKANAVSYFNGIRN